LFLSTLALSLFSFHAFSQNKPLDLRLPTDNTALLTTAPGPDYFQFVDRDFEGEKSTPWQGGQFGFFRDPRRLGSQIAYARFHEGMDVKPMQRDAAGNPLDEVRAIMAGEVAYVAAGASLSNYGRYVVVKHDWGEGPFFSLYAHLREAHVNVGQRVAAGAGIGRMGFTGSGIDQRRAHVHLELNILLNSQFDLWHATHFRTTNHHGIHNGLNLLGVDIQALYLAHQKNPSLSVARFVRDSEVYYEIVVPGNATMEIANRYRWLRGDDAILAVTPPSWVVRCTRWGLPVSVKPGAKAVQTASVSWVKDGPLPHYNNTRGIITGSGPTGKLTVEGLRFVKLMCGMAP
jgi:murein DD-endopeptidase MepM/ murein hydrolase activator NlpD